MWIAQEPLFGAATGYGLTLPIPSARAEYHNVDNLRWSAEFQQWKPVRDAMRTETVLSGGVRDHQPGKTYADQWNSAVFTPSMANGDWASRSADTMSLTIPLFGDAGFDRTGTSIVESAATVLYREGVKVGETDLPGQGAFDVPPDSARYRLEARANRAAFSRYSTEIACVWTFASARPESRKDGVPLPLLAVRFAPPDLNSDNQVMASTTRIPLTVQRQEKTPPTTIPTLRIAASNDDGRTWFPVPITRAPGSPDAVATIAHPPGTRHIALRADATDAEGNTAEQTILRAYEISSR
ncbi:hypothetical protein [Actinokineospora iranica]|uniref:Uncharacterized protein n=1 Tax=Actinokineospora iranica TaxID=1271860 RepID=A0A1G6LEE8_9PSEU|nr:hypothetical protein [Actinokineospora iranica]SDC41584.1 hypothetical protein SAMN05216174_10228 [Actinokineospora iranica]